MDSQNVVRGRLADVRTAMADIVAGDPDAREPSMRRLVALIPCVLDRLDAELGRIADLDAVLDGLRRLDRVVEWIGAPPADPPDWSLDVEGDARFFRDLRRIDTDLQIWRTMLLEREMMRRPPEPEEDAPPETWLAYFHETMRLEELIVAIVEVEGFSPQTLEIGARRAAEDRERYRGHGERWMLHTAEDAERDGWFDPLEPMRFLDLQSIPEPELMELPPVEDEPFDEADMPEIVRDPVWAMIYPVTEALGVDEATPLGQYVNVLAERAREPFVWPIERSGRRRGALRFAAECLDRVVEATGDRSVADLAAKLRGLAVE